MRSVEATTRRPWSGRCNFGDFQDIQFGPDDTPWVSLIDACVDTCVRPATDAEKANDANDGIVGRLVFAPATSPGERSLR